MAERVRVIGVGNPDRGDDGVGPAVAARVANLADPLTEVTVSTADPSRLMERWDGADAVVIVDAVVDGAAPGTIRVVDLAQGPLPPDIAAVTTHGMGVGAAIDLARAMGRLPRRVVVVGVSAEHFEGRHLTDPVQRAVPDAADTVLEVARHA